jgi:two-component system, OmpR family, alkaline phosphatase synthesis response regulator PhoP
VHKILIADDNPQILELLEAYLEPLALQIVLAADGQSALEVAQREQPDLILLDIMMPKRSGFEVCRLLKDDPRYRDIPIIMVTALNEFGDIERARECGAEDFLCKPVSKSQLLERVQSLLKLAKNRGKRPGRGRAGNSSAAG